MSGSQESRDHHYIPAFYQKQWGIGGKLFAYSRPFKCIVMKSCSPYATGFERDLYALHSYPSPTRAVLEDRVLKQIDQQASDALQSLLEWQGQSLPLKTKVAWARFVLSLHLRHPDSVANLRRLWADDYRDRFDALRRDLQSDVEDWDDESRADQGFGMLYSRVLSSAEVITFIIGMQWHTLTVQGAANSLAILYLPNPCWVWQLPYRQSAFLQC